MRTTTPRCRSAPEQTISQPYMVARICAELQLHGDEKVLDVGTGSGYQAAVLAELAREVHSLERIPALAGHARAPRSPPRATPAASTSTTRTAPCGLPAEAPFRASPSRPPRGAHPPLCSSSSSPRGRLVIPIGPRHQQFLTVYVQTPEGAAELRRRPVPVRAARRRTVDVCGASARLDSMAPWGPSPRLRRSGFPCACTGSSSAGRPTSCSTSSRGTSSASSCAAATSRCAFFPGRRRSRRTTEIAVGSALMLLEDVGFYERRSVSFRSLVGGDITVGGVLRDVYIGDGGAVTELEIERDGERWRISPTAGRGLRPRGRQPPSYRCPPRWRLRSAAAPRSFCARAVTGCSSASSASSAQSATASISPSTPLLLHGGLHYLARRDLLVPRRGREQLHAQPALDRSAIGAPGSLRRGCASSSSRSPRSARTCSCCTSSSRFGAGQARRPGDRDRARDAAELRREQAVVVSATVIAPRVSLSIAICALAIAPAARAAHDVRDGAGVRRQGASHPGAVRTARRALRT